VSNITIHVLICWNCGKEKEKDRKRGSGGRGRKKEEENVEVKVNGVVWLSLVGLWSN